MVQFDPLNSARNTGRGEYGGSRGPFQPKAEGHVLDADTHGTREKRRILAHHMTPEQAGLMPELDVTDTSYAAVQEAIKRRDEKLGDWTLDDAL